MVTLRVLDINYNLIGGDVLIVLDLLVFIRYYPWLVITMSTLSLNVFCLTINIRTYSKSTNKLNYIVYIAKDGNIPGRSNSTMFKLPTVTTKWLTQAQWSLIIVTYEFVISYELGACVYHPHTFQRYKVKVDRHVGRPSHRVVIVVPLNH